MTIDTGSHYPIQLMALPAGWRAGHVGDFAKKIEPGFASGEHNQFGDGVPHLRPMNIDRDGRLALTVVKSVAGSKDRRRLVKGDVLFNNTNSPELVGKTTAIARDEEFAFSNHMTRIRFQDDVRPAFGALQLHYLWMRGYFKYNCVKHVNQASVSSGALARMVPFVWAPLRDQDAIVAEIEKQFSRLDEAVANLQRVKANLKRFASVVLRQAVSGRLVATEAQQAQKSGHAYQHAAQALGRILGARIRMSRQRLEPLGELDNLPDGWCWSTIDQLAEVGTGATPSRSEPAFYLDGDIPWVTSSAANRPYVDRESEFVTKAALERTNLTVYAPGTLLVAMYGEGKTRGKCTELRIAAATNQALAAIQTIPEVRPYLKVFFEHNYEETRKVASGGVQPNLNLGLVRSINVPLPPLAEQRRIVAEVDRRLSIVREVEAGVETNLKRAQALRQGVLGRAFQG